MHFDLQAARVQKRWEITLEELLSGCTVLWSSLFCSLLCQNVYFITVNLATFKPLLLTGDIKVPYSD